MYSSSGIDSKTSAPAVGIDASPVPLERRLSGSTLLQRNNTEGSRAVSADDSTDLSEVSQEMNYGLAPSRSYVRPHSSSAASSSIRLPDTLGSTPQMLQPRRLERLNSRITDPEPATVISPTLMFASRPFERRPMAKGCWSECSSFLKMCTLLTLAIFGTIVYIIYITMRPEMPRYELRDITISEFVLHSGYNSTSGANGQQRTMVRQLEFGLPELCILAINPSRYGQIRYHDSTIHIRYRGAELGSDTFHGFIQKPNHARLLSLSLPTAFVVFDGAHGRNITSDFMASFIQINVEGSVKVGLSIFGLVLSSPVSHLSCYMNVIPSNSTHETSATVISKACS